MDEGNAWPCSAAIVSASSNCGNTMTLSGAYRCKQRSSAAISSPAAPL
jgi:hypothetical protein